LEQTSGSTIALDATLVNRRFSLFLPDPSNAAPEWQALSMRWRSREIVVACPLEGLVRMATMKATQTRD
jgi:hypothetical protein